MLKLPNIKVNFTPKSNFQTIKKRSYSKPHETQSHHHLITSSLNRKNQFTKILPSSNFIQNHILKNHHNKWKIEGGPGGGLKKLKEGRPIETWQQTALVVIAVSWITLIVILPFVNVFVQAFSEGIGPLINNLTDPDFLHAAKMTVLLALICVPINTIFGTLYFF